MDKLAEQISKSFNFDENPFKYGQQYLEKNKE